MSGTAAEVPLSLALREELGDAIETARTVQGELTLRVRREEIARVCATLRERHGFTRLVDLCGVDLPGRTPRFEVVYHLADPAADRRVRVKITAGEDTPVPSVTSVWRAADWPEREVWDLLGVRFEEHPDLSRLLLWEGFDGHPLRKDFPVEGRGAVPAEEAAREAAGDELELLLGPQHPALQGVLALRLKVDGERIVDCRPGIGHLHRGLEKLLEGQPLVGAAGIALTDHLDFTAPITTNLAYAGAVERLLGVEAPPRARFLRTVFAELQRIASHLLWLGTHASDAGAAPPLAAALAMRDRVLDLWEAYLAGYPGESGLRPGGLSHDLPEGWAGQCREFLGEFPAALGRCEGILTESRLWKKRTVGLGVLSPEAAVELGVTGPALRASGVAWDLRRARPCEAWEEVEFDVPVGRNGDTYDRYRVRIEEMRQAARIAVQCLDGLPDGPVLADLPTEAPRDAEAYHSVEGPRGEIGFYLTGDGGARPWRCHARTPSFANLQALPEICRGERVGDLVTLTSSLDVALGEVDR